MTLSLSIYVVATKILFVASAPKLRYVLFDPLMYEAKAGPFSARRDSSVSEAPTTRTPADHDAANLILSDSSEEFLKNNEEATETSTIVTTTQTTPEKEATSAPVLRSKSCFSCIGSLRTDDSASFPLKSLPIYLRVNENQKDYPKFGYEFDEAVCKLVSNRILCGYNKNTGTIANSKEEVHVDAECRIRGDRIECGYGNAGGVGRKGRSGKRALKLRLPVTDKTVTTFKLKDILHVETTLTNETEEIQPVTVKLGVALEETKAAPVTDDSLTKGIRNTTESSEELQPVDKEAYSTIAASLSDTVVPTTSATPTTTNVTLKISDTTTETDSTTASTEIKTEINSEVPFLSLRSIMKMNEDLEKLARQGQGSETETTEYVPAVTRCVEIGDRIVCYNYKPRSTVPAVTLSSKTST